MSDTPVKVSMSADLDVIKAPVKADHFASVDGWADRPFKGEAETMGVQSTEDDLNLQVALDEPEQLARALFKIATGLNSNPRWAVIAKHTAAANEELEELNKPSR